jgi:hypothetical protein
MSSKSAGATIFVRGKFGALTTCYKSEPGINRKKIILLDARGDEVR